MRAVSRRGRLGLHKPNVPRPSTFQVAFVEMNGQEAFRRLSQQLQKAGRGAGGSGPRMPGKGFFAGSGLLVALVGGGLALNASLFNGA